jgi:hypothetical protein
MDRWIVAARKTLLRSRTKGAWGYRAGGAPAAEPTALACLGLLATDPGDGVPRPLALEASTWLAGLQQADGSVGVSETLAKPGWPTPHALLLWSALGQASDPRAQRASRWLEDRRGTTTPRTPNSVAGHDTTIVGWPWVEGTHSWIEPTALAVLALARTGRLQSPRVREGLRLIRDRAVPSGGWNYGNSIVLGRALRPMPGPTGLALVALSLEGELSEKVIQAQSYLQAILPKIRSPQSLCWGILGLAAWGQRPKDAGSWLEQSLTRAARRPDLPLQTAYALLGAGPRALDLLGIDHAGKEGP